MISSANAAKREGVVKFGTTFSPNLKRVTGKGDFVAHFMSTLYTFEDLVVFFLLFGLYMGIMVQQVY